MAKSSGAWMDTRDDRRGLRRALAVGFGAVSATLLLAGTALAAEPAGRLASTPPVRGEVAASATDVVVLNDTFADNDLDRLVAHRPRDR